MGVTRYSQGGEDGDVDKNNPAQAAAQRLLTDGGDPIEDADEEDLPESVTSYADSEEVTQAQRDAAREEAKERLEGSEVPGRVVPEDGAGGPDERGEIDGEDPQETVEAVMEELDQTQENTERVPAATAGEQTEIDWQSDEVPEEVERGNGITDQARELSVEPEGSTGTDGALGEEEPGGSEEEQDLQTVDEVSNRVEVDEEIRGIVDGDAAGTEDGRQEAESDVAWINAQLPSDDSVVVDEDPERDSLGDRSTAVGVDELAEFESEEIDGARPTDPAEGGEALSPDTTGELRGEASPEEYYTGVAPQQGEFLDTQGELTAQEGESLGAIGAAQGEVTGDRELLTEYTETGRAPVVAVEESRINASATDRQDRALLMEASIGGEGDAATFRDEFARNRTGLEAEEQRVGEFQAATRQRESVWYRDDALGTSVEELEQGPVTGNSQEQLAELNELLEKFGGVSRSTSNVVAIRTDPLNREEPERRLQEADAIENVAQVTSTDNYLLVEGSSVNTGRVKGIVDGMPHVEEVVGEMSVADIVGRFQEEGVTDQVEMGQFEHAEEVIGQHESPGAYWEALQVGPAEVGGFGSEEAQYFDVDGNGTWVGSQTVDEFTGVGSQTMGPLVIDSAFPETLTVDNFAQALSQNYTAGRESGQTALSEFTGGSEEGEKTQARQLLDALDEDESRRTVRSVSLTEDQKDALEGPVQHTLNFNADVAEAKELLMESSDVDMQRVREQVEMVGEAHQQVLAERRQTGVHTSEDSNTVDKELVEQSGSDSNFVSKSRVVGAVLQERGSDALDERFVAELDDYIGGVDSLEQGTVNELAEEWLVEQGKMGIRPTRAAQLLQQREVQVKAFTNGFTPTDTGTGERVSKPLNEYTPERSDSGGTRPVPKVKTEVTVTDVDESVGSGRNRGDVYQRFRVQDDAGNESFVTVFKDGVEFPDEVTEGASGDYHEDLANQAIHWKNVVGPGDKIALDGFMVQDPENGKGITVDGNGSPSLASTPDSQIRIDERNSTPEDRVSGEVPSPDYSNYETSSRPDTGGPSGAGAGSRPGRTDPSKVGPDGLLAESEVDISLTQEKTTSDRVEPDEIQLNLKEGHGAVSRSGEGADTTGTYGEAANPDAQYQDRSDRGF
jgi:hypothetical protein